MAAEILAKLCPQGKILLVLPQPDERIALSMRNLSRVNVIAATELNAYVVLAAECLILLKDSLPIIGEIFGGTE